MGRLTSSTRPKQDDSASETPAKPTIHQPLHQPSRHEGLGILNPGGRGGFVVPVDVPVDVVVDVGGGDVVVPVDVPVEGVMIIHVGRRVVLVAVAVLV
ncbi:MAG TPA: hypothetical protein PLJ27_21165, partial [Polyangiaceae bacterium]|nr:hypothetical protein [Polyangiaceae bacterium]